jgi:OmpA-OmpF porin, OOP family
MKCFRAAFFLSILMSNVTCFGNSFTQVSDTRVAVQGKILDQETQEPIVGKLFYEKLPYYDDMGIGSSKHDNGSYQLFMIKNVTYNLKVSATGYAGIEILDLILQKIYKNSIY